VSGLLLPESLPVSPLSCFQSPPVDAFFSVLPSLSLRSRRRRFPPLFDGKNHQKMVSASTVLKVPFPLNPLNRPSFVSFPPRRWRCLCTFFPLCRFGPFVGSLQVWFGAFSFFFLYSAPLDTLLPFRVCPPAPSPDFLVFVFFLRSIALAL